MITYCIDFRQKLISTIFLAVLFRGWEQSHLDELEQNVCPCPIEGCFSVHFYAKIVFYSLQSDMGVYGHCPYVLEHLPKSDTALGRVYINIFLAEFLEEGLVQNCNNFH